MIKAYSMEPAWFIPDDQADLPEDKQAGFLLRMPTRAWKARMEDEVTRLLTIRDSENANAREFSIAMGTKRRMRVKFGLMNWKGMTGPDEEPLEDIELGEDGLCPDEILDVIPDDYFDQISERIRDLGEVSGEDEKNLPSAPGSESGTSDVPAPSAAGKKA